MTDATLEASAHADDADAPKTRGRLRRAIGNWLRRGTLLLIWLCLAVVLSMAVWSWRTPIDLHTQDTAYGYRFAWTYLIRTGLHLMGFAALFGAVVAWLLKARWTALAALAGSILVGWSFWASLIPHGTPDAHGPGFRLMTNNLYYLNENVDQLVAAIRESGADVVALQEFTPLHRTAVLEHLQDIYPYTDLLPAHIPGGMALLSKFPFQNVTLPPGNRPVGPWRKSILDVHGTAVTLHVVHLSSPGLDPNFQFGVIRSILGVPQVNMNRRQLFYVMADMKNDTNPTILCGDFNANPDTPQLHALKAAGYSDAYDLAGYGPGYSWPTNRPEMGMATWLPGFRIDHIMLDGQLTAIDAHLGPATGSDHRPVIAEIRLKKSMTAATIADAQ